jgi:hypothetical protein
VKKKAPNFLTAAGRQKEGSKDREEKKDDKEATARENGIEPLFRTVCA